MKFACFVYISSVFSGFMWISRFIKCCKLVEIGGKRMGGGGYGQEQESASMGC